MKARFLALAALVLGLASCQTEPEGLNVNVGGEQDVTVCVSLPETTRANNSAEGAFENVDLTGDATIRYILKIYQKVGAEYVASDDRQVEYSDDKSVVFDVRLVPNRDYRFVVWADYVEGEADVDYHYNTADLTNITLKNSWVAMDETRDAFTGYYNTADGDKRYSAGLPINITLTRPFAKLRVITTDMEQLNDLGIAPTTATVEYTTTHYNAFNAFAGEAIGDSKNRNIKHENFTIKAYGDNVNDESKVLFTDYFFANNDVVKFNLTVVDQNGAVIDDTIAFTTDINVKRNHLTTITGNILTDGNNVTVKVEDDFANEYIYIEGDFTLTQDMVIDRPLAVRAGAKAVINLNGHNIINNTKSETFGEGEGIIVYGELDIVGNGTVQGSTMAVWARGNAGAVVNIYGGTFLGCEEGFAKGGRSVVYASSGNVVNIYGGKVQSLAADKTSYANKTEGVYAALNVADNNGMINVYGGSFYKQNPAAPGTEPAAWNAAHPNGFVVPGYTSKQSGDWYVVGVDTIDNADEFNAALTAANAGDTILLGEDAVIEGTFTVNKSVNVASVDANAPATITGRVYIKGCKGTFTSVKFDTNDASKSALELNGWSGYQYKAIVGIATNGEATFNKCSFKFMDTSAITNSIGYLKISECNFFGDSYAVYTRANIEITNSSFEVTPAGVGQYAGIMHVCGMENGKVTVKNVTGRDSGGDNISHIMFLGSTNLDANGAYMGPVTFDVQGNTGFTYSFYKGNGLKISHEDHIFAEGSAKFTGWTY